MSKHADWMRIKELFDEALGREPGERAAFLRATCGDDTPLSAEVESLLAAHAQAGSFAERPAFHEFDRADPEFIPPTESRVLHGGDRLGAYEILAPLGSGSMGEVYRARDTRLNRMVAIKVLPARMGADPVWRSRFEREARAIAALHDPHICTLHDIGHEDGTDFLVLEYLEGETLADRVREAPLRIDQALTIATEIANALAATHRQGIVHRDLKPANVMLTTSGAKLLDFGLARWRPFVSTTSPGELGSSQTLTSEGTLVGTLPYMAPEQLEGKEADARTDIFAFGAILYEIIAGRRAFGGESPTQIIAAILRDDPPKITMAKPQAPAFLDYVIRRCLAKPADERWQSAADVGTALEWITSQGAAGPSSPASAGALAGPRLGWAVAAVAVATLLAIVAWYGARSSSESRVIRLSVVLPEHTRMFPDEWPAISPDGRQVAFAAAQTGEEPVLWIRELDAPAAHRLSGTDGASSPFWSPDSRSIGFYARGKQKRFNLSDGISEVLCDAGAGFGGAAGGTWSHDDSIVFTPGGWSPLARVASRGGTVTPVTTLDQSRSEQYHVYPAFLPDGRHFVYVAVTPRVEDTAIYVGELGSTYRTMLLKAFSTVAYSPSGHLLFGNDGVVMAQPFDPKTRRLVGEPVRIADHAHAQPDGATLFSISETGVLAYRNEDLPQFQLTWVDRSGKPLVSVGPPGPWQYYRLSPDGQNAALVRPGDFPAGYDLWLLDLRRGLVTRLTDHPSWDLAPVWSSDSRRIAFSSDRNGSMNLFEMSSEVVTKPHALLESAVAKLAADWSLDQRNLLYATNERNKWELWMLPMTANRNPVPLVPNTGFNIKWGSFSPDGQSVAYSSDESGRDEVFVQRLPPTGPRVRISTNGGHTPRWRRDGKELFYCGLDNTIMAVDLTTNGAGLEPDVPRSLFALDPVAAGQGLLCVYEPSADGQRFLIRSPLASAAASISIVLNWPAALKN
jgi:serine/threonine protein kinase